MNKTNNEVFHTASADVFRFAEIYWLATLMPHADDATDLAYTIDDFDFECEEIAHAFGIKVADTEELYEHILANKKWGFLAKFETPIISKRGYSWSTYTATWIYAETIDALTDVAQRTCATIRAMADSAEV